ncbi:GntR family transcriptional regulator [Streptomyces sioyaensis]|uniref:GntR family transcriptional regulator n=1 Tax=Streptomyces sioyaensis TaxID=67364 RepID=UPI0036C07BE2
MTEPVRPAVRLSRVVYDELKSRLVEGRYAPGSRISIEDVKDEFGVSKQPVMEALRQLSTLGLVEIAPQSGCRVISYSPQEAQDFFMVFASFESELAAAAAQRRSPAQIDELDHTLRELVQAEQDPDLVHRVREYFVLNRAFHQIIHDMAHSPVVADMSERMWNMSDFLMNTMGGPEPLARAVHDRNHDHDTILNAIRHGNELVARAAMQHHIRTIVRLFDGLE